ncbi:MAG: methyltransferase domain-containing protein [Nitrososphaerota archaeon]
MVKPNHSKINSYKRGTRYRRCLGPIDDLEHYVHHEWWRQIFDAFYLKTDGDVVNNPEITRMEIDLITNALDLKTEHKILDLCCGHGRHSIELAMRGFMNVEGVDISKYLISRARAWAKSRGLSISFRVGDARRLTYPDNCFDAVLILGNSFGYFERIDDDLKVLREVYRILRPYGRVLIDLTNGEYIKNNYEKRTWEWIDKRHIAFRERCLAKDGKRLITREVVVSTDKGVIVDQFYAVRLYSYEELRNLLETAGFSNILLHDKLCMEHGDGRDKGMMSNRLVVSATAMKGNGNDGL